jgi:hypothetical protein
MELKECERTYYVCYINEENDFDFDELTLLPYETPTPIGMKIKIDAKYKSSYRCLRVVSWSLMNYKEV